MCQWPGNLQPGLESAFLLAHIWIFQSSHSSVDVYRSLNTKGEHFQSGITEVTLYARRNESTVQLDLSATTFRALFAWLFIETFLILCFLYNLFGRKTKPCLLLCPYTVRLAFSNHIDNFTRSTTFILAPGVFEVCLNSRFYAL